MSRGAVVAAFEGSVYLVDTHVHLDMLDGGVHAVESALKAASNKGVKQVITIGIDLATSEKAVSVASGHEGVFAAVGVHPHDAVKSGDETWEHLLRLASDRRVVAWGEIGLDYAKLYSPKDVQKRVFTHQLGMAMKSGLPVIIHDRDAHGDTLDILALFARKGLGGVFHCYSGDVAMARTVLDMGFFISVTGVVTFRNAEGLRDVVRYVPMDRLMVETDSPFLSPVPFRGRKNDPSRVRIVAEAVAELKSLSIEEVAECTSRNARDLFALPLP